MRAHHDSYAHGLMHDLETLLRQTNQRRQTLRWLGAATALPWIGSGAPGNAAAASSCNTIPDATAGPFPGDGSNRGGGGSTANALGQSGIVRNQLNGSFAGASGLAAGVPLSITLKLVNSAANCASLAGHAVYVWHCDALGRYSMYSPGAVGENYLRGVQVSNSAGEVSFTSVFPGCYAGRWPHIHLEVFPSLASATHGNKGIKTSQLALPSASCKAVYADPRYGGSAAYFAGTSLVGDFVFRDGAVLQLASVTGDNAAGYEARLELGVPVRS